MGAGERNCLGEHSAESGHPGKSLRGRIPPALLNRLKPGADNPFPLHACLQFIPAA